MKGILLYLAEHLAPFVLMLVGVVLAGVGSNDSIGTLFWIGGGLAVVGFLWGLINMYRHRHRWGL